MTEDACFFCSAGDACPWHSPWKMPRAVGAVEIAVNPPHPKHIIEYDPNLPMVFCTSPGVSYVVKKPTQDLDSHLNTLGASEMVDLNSILSRPADDIKAPPPAPPGHYTFNVSKYEIIASKGRNNNPCVTVEFQAIAAGDDVDQGQLAEIGGLSKVSSRRDFWLTEEAAFMFKEFLENACQIPSSGRTMSEMIPEMVNKQVVGTVVQRPVNDQTGQPTGRMRSEISAFAKVS